MSSRAAFFPLADAACEFGFELLPHAIDHLIEVRRADRTRPRQIVRDIELDAAGPRREQRNALAEINGFREAVRDENDGPPHLPPDRDQLVAEQDARLLVERGKGLVHQDDIGLERQRPAQRNALRHAARKLPRVGVGEFLEPDETEIFQRTLAPLRLVDILRFEAELDILQHRAPRIEHRVLKHIGHELGVGPGHRLACDQHTAAVVVKGNEAGDDIEQGRLAAAARPQQDQEIVFLRRDADLIEGADHAIAGGIVIGLADPRDLDDRHLRWWADCGLEIWLARASRS